MQESQQVLEWQREAREEGREEGRIQTTRRDVLHALQTRFRVQLPDDLCRRIEGESDLPTLDRWFDAALTAESLDAFCLQL